jgi:hypothetical protein
MFKAGPDISLRIQSFAAIARGAVDAAEFRGAGVPPVVLRVTEIGKITGGTPAPRKARLS